MRSCSPALRIVDSPSSVMMIRMSIDAISATPRWWVAGRFMAFGF
jgi:hypothetical protein